MPQSFRSLAYLWSAVFSAAAVGAATLQAAGPVSTRGAESAGEAASRPVTASAPQPTWQAPARAEASSDAAPAIDLAAPSPAVLAAGITELRRPPAAAAPVALPGAVPAALPGQPVMAAAALPQPAPTPTPRVRVPAPARRPPPPMEAAFAPPPPAPQGYASPRSYASPQGYASYAPTGYIGVYTRTPDGTRMFRSYP